ncbi:DUF6894 family protein [Muricoccus nepalensis]|uniref:DUF6894 family protein n=1 Tax=Muricoccus nepalensis TaxID=1854500 RepID=UPI00112A4C5C|nr:hypothetical protein [Roseomonas nepalensis]
MPLFYFDIWNGQIPEQDNVGLQMPNVDVARHEAIAALLSIARDSLQHDRPALAVAVRNEEGGVVLTASLLLTVKLGHIV